MMKNLLAGLRAPIGAALCAALVASALPPVAVADDGTGYHLDPGRTQNLWTETFSTVGADATGILRYPIDHPKATGLALLGVGLLVLADKPVTQFHQRNVERAFSGFSLPQLPWEKPFTKAGLAREDVWMLSAMGASYLYGAVAGDDRARRAALLSAKAVFYSFVTTQLLLKTVTGRMRPCQDLSNPNCPNATFTNNPFDFGNFHGVSLSPDGYGSSMPSFHFTDYFAVARVYSGIYDNSWVPYGIAGLLSVSNIRGHNHWVSDMAAGALVGIAIGSVVLTNARRYQAGEFSATPYVSQGGAGLIFRTEF